MDSFCFKSPPAIAAGVRPQKSFNRFGPPISQLIVVGQLGAFGFAWFGKSSQSHPQTVVQVLVGKSLKRHLGGRQQCP